MAKHHLTWVLAFGLALIAYVTLEPIHTLAAEPSVQHFPGVPGSNDNTDPDFVFSKTGVKQVEDIKYRFKRNPEDPWIDVTCRMNLTERLKAESAFGYLPDRWGRTLEDVINEQGKKAGILKLGMARLSHTLIPTWTQVKGSYGSNPEKEEQNFNFWYSVNKGTLRSKALHKFETEHSFILPAYSSWLPAYSTIVSNASTLLQDCGTEFDNRSPADKSRLLMEFFQAMRFEPIKEESSDGRQTGGVRLPCCVMALGAGDCDSKAAAFCSIYRTPQISLVLFRSLRGDPRHALVGIGAYPRASAAATTSTSTSTRRFEATLKEGLYDLPVEVPGLDAFWPIEVSGQGRARFKEVAIGHGGPYLVIPIANVAVPDKRK